MACHDYHDSYNTLPRDGDPRFPDTSHGPTGGVAASPPNVGYEPGAGTGCCGNGWAHWSWAARLLPYIEQSVLAGKENLDTGDMNTAGGSMIVAAYIKTYVCPSDGYTMSQKSRTSSADMGGVVCGLGSYKGVAGANWGADAYPGDGMFGGDYPNPTPGGSGAAAYNGLERGDGLFWRGDMRFGKLTLMAITDGTSNTFMIGECLPEKDLWSAWAYSNGSTATCAIPPNVRKSDGTEYDPSDWPNIYSFMSNHPGGVQFAYADGHVSFISNEIALAAYRALATSHSGDIASPE